MCEKDTEDVIEWYQHYMNISAIDLAGEYLSCTLHDEREVSPEMQAAAEERRTEITRTLYDAANN
jgi:hypothetical protein